MDVNRLFSLQSNGYDISEVDDYVGFIQTELTKKMKLSRDIQLQKNGLYETIDKLNADNLSLNEKNEKLYRDCVAFAKRLKALEVYDNSPEFEAASDVDEPTSKMITEIKDSYQLIIKENQELKSQLLELTSVLNDFHIVDGELNKKNIVDFDSEKPSSIDKSTEIIIEEFIDEDKVSVNQSLDDNNNNSSNKNIFSSASNNDLLEIEDQIIEFTEDKPENKTLPTYTHNKELDNKNNINQNKRKNIKKQRNDFPKSIFNFIITLLLYISIVFSVISILVVVFIKNPEITVLGYRTYTVKTESSAFNFATNDILVTKKISPIEIKPDSVILYNNKKGTERNTKKVAAVETIDGNICYNVKKYADDLEFETVPQQTVLGVVTSKIPNIGKITNYAFSNPYDYVAIIACVFFLSLFFKIMISFNKTKVCKIKFDDYDISDFSLDV